MNDLCRTLVALIVLAVLIAACGRQETPIPASTAEPTDTVAPTEPPPPTSVPEPTATVVPSTEPSPPTAAPEPTAAVAPPTELPPAEGSITEFEPVTVDGLVGIVWQWTELVADVVAVHSVVPNPVRYTVEFLLDGQASIKADCNTLSWAYTLEGNSLTFDTLGSTTLAFCGVGSLDQQYLALLSNTDIVSLDDERLTLGQVGGVGLMGFNPGAPKGAASTEPVEAVLEPSEVSLDTQGLPYSWQAVLVPATPYDQSQPPGPVGLPAHIEILFGRTDPADVQPGDPIMYIIPVNPYRQMWDEAGNPSVTKTIAKIDRYSYMMPQPLPTSGMPVLPYEEIGAGYNDLAVQIARIVPAGQLNTTSGTQDGYRFVGRWAQDANPVTNQGLRYVYQGYTNDGVYLVSLWWPVSTTALPNDVSEVPANEVEQFQTDPTTVISKTAVMLNGLAPDQWQPDLTTLDALVASLQIEGMVVGGIQDTLWEWVEGPVQPGSSETVNIEDPSLYQVSYGSHGNLQYIADCNSGGMHYELHDGGTNGGMLVQPGPATLVACGPESLSEGFAFSLQAAQSYRVQAGGNQMELVLPAGGGTLLLRAAGAPPPEGGREGETETQASQACITGAVTYAESTTLPDDAVAQVQLQDTSLMDAPAAVMGEQIIPDPVTFPIAYEVCYDPGEIEENHTYTMQARIEDGAGSLLYINDTSIPVITRGNPSDVVELPVIEVGT